MKFEIFLALVLLFCSQACQTACHGQSNSSRPASVPTLPYSSPDHPLFNVNPILDIIGAVQNASLATLGNLGNLAYNFTNGVINELRQLRESFYSTVSSQVQQAIENLRRLGESARNAIENQTREAENRLLSLQQEVQHLAGCTRMSVNFNQTRNAVLDLQNDGYNCVAAKINQGIEIFNELVENLTKQGTTVFNLPDQIEVCNKRQSGLLDVLGFAARSTCLGAIPANVTGDTVQFFNTIVRAVIESGAYAASIPGSLAQCASNTLNNVTSDVENATNTVAECARSG